MREALISTVYVIWKTLVPPPTPPTAALPGGRTVEHLVALLRREHSRHTRRGGQDVRHLGEVPAFRPDSRQAPEASESDDMLDGL